MYTTITNLTHADSAWLLLAPPAVFTALVCAGVLLILRIPLQRLIERIAAALQRGRGAEQAIDPALQWTPRSMELEPVVASSIAGAAIAVGSVSLFGPAWLAILLCLPFTALVIGGLMYTGTRRYAAHLERDLTTAIGRMAALLRGGSSFQMALERLTTDMSDSPLRSEWRYLLERVGVPLANGGLATPQQVVLALAAQTPVPRHALLLDHLSVAVGQPQDVLSRRCDAAYAAFLASEQRREEANTELSQMRYSGFAVGLAGLSLALYLAITQWERVITAYSSPLGLLFGLIVVGALLLPIGGGMILAQVEDLDY